LEEGRAVKLHARKGLAAREAQVWELVDGAWRRYGQPVLSIDTEAQVAVVLVAGESGSERFQEKAVSGRFAVRLKEGSAATRADLLYCHSKVMVDELLSPLPGQVADQKHARGSSNA
jgi:hypothetical protein